MRESMGREIHTTIDLTDPEWSWCVGASGEPGIIDAQRLHRRVYESQGYVAEAIVNDEGLLVDRWTPASHHLALWHAAGSDAATGGPVGHLRLIDRSAGPLQAEMLWHRLDLPETCWEVSSLVLDPQRTRPFATVRQLYRRAFHYSEDRGCTHWVGVVEPSLKRILKRCLGVPMEILGDPIDYMGTPNQPILMSFEEGRRAMATGAMDPWFARDNASTLATTV